MPTRNFGFRRDAQDVVAVTAPLPSSALCADQGGRLGSAAYSRVERVRLGLPVKPAVDSRLERAPTG